MVGLQDLIIKKNVFTMSEYTYLINNNINTLSNITKGPKKSDLGNGTLYNGEV